MNRKTWIIGSAVVAVLTLAVVWVFWPKPVEVEFSPVTQGPFETTIDEDGKTRLTDRYVVSAPLAGRLARIQLKEGDAVTADMPLAQLSSVLPAMQDERTLRELRARAASAQDNVARAGSRAARAQVSLDQANSDLRRSEQLAQQGFIAPAKVQSDRLATIGVQREFEAAGAERRMALHELEQAQAASGSVQQSATTTNIQPNAKTDPKIVARMDASKSRSFTVRAPTAGRVLRVLQTSEGVAALGTPLIEIGDTARMEIVADLLTTDALVAKPGYRVMIERWGGMGILQGRVRSVEPAAFTKISALGVEEQRVRVLIDITSPPADWQALGDGYRVSVRIVTLAQEKAVQVPVSAVFPLPAQTGQSASGQPLNAPRFAVFVADGGRAKQVPIQLGARNGSAAWISGGLAVGQQVIVYPPAMVTDGKRVAQRKS
jgi:HlyD family secretion protein